MPRTNDRKKPEGQTLNPALTSVATRYVLLVDKKLGLEESDSKCIKLVNSKLMKNYYLTVVLLITCSFAYAQSEINPIKQGQYFEQGYGMPNYTFTNEEATTDVQKIPQGLVFTGYTGNETDGYNMAFWQVDEIGALFQFGSYGDNVRDQMANAIAPDPYGGFCLVGRETDFYSYNHQTMHSTIVDGDQILIKYISDVGIELSSTKLGAVDTPQVAVDVINDGSGNFIVLANRRYSEFDTQDMRVIKIDPTGTIIWDKIHSISNTNIFGQKIIADGSGFLILSNDIDNQEPLLYKISANGTYEAAYTYTQNNPTIAFGIAANSSGYHLAGESDNGTNGDGIIISINTSFVETSTITETNPIAGNEGFRDIVAHPNGYLATGTCDNLGEGMNDVWIVHYDNSFVNEKVETLGGEDEDYGYSAVLVPEVFSVFVGGFNSSYGIVESGNAYLGGVKVDMGLPESGICELPRALHVKVVNIVPGQSGILDPNSGIINFTLKEDSLIDFADSNNIQYLVLYGANQIFRPANNNTTLGKNYKKYLNKFISKCLYRGIKCGVVSGYKEATYDTMRVYNVSSNIGKYGYLNSGKISFFMLEYEFWNAHLADFAPPTSGLPASMNQHFINTFNRHKNILKLLKNQKYKNANINGIYDYLAWPFFTWNGAGNAYSENNVSFSKTIMEEIDSLCDAIFLVYYKTYQPFPNHEGRQFLTNSSNIWNKRLSYIGKKSTKSVIMPLFSAEYYRDINDKCGQGSSTNFLGIYLDGPPANSGTYIGNDFFSVEDTMLDQHALLYSNTSTYPDIKNVDIGAFGWFSYKCVKEKNFIRKKLNLCRPFTNPVAIQLESSISDLFLIYPNPADNQIIIESQLEGDFRIELRGLSGMLIQSKKGNGNILLETTNLITGTYILRIQSNYQVINKKIIIAR